MQYAWIMCANSVVIKQDTQGKYYNRRLFLSSVLKLVYVPGMQRHQFILDAGYAVHGML